MEDERTKNFNNVLKGTVKPGDHPRSTEVSYRCHRGVYSTRMCSFTMYSRRGADTAGTLPLLPKCDTFFIFIFFGQGHKSGHSSLHRRSSLNKTTNHTSFVAQALITRQKSIHQETMTPPFNHRFILLSECKRIVSCFTTGQYRTCRKT